MILILSGIFVVNVLLYLALAYTIKVLDQTGFAVNMMPRKEWEEAKEIFNSFFYQGLFFVAGILIVAVMIILSFFPEEG